MRDFQKLWAFLASNTFQKVNTSPSTRQQEDNQNREQQSLQGNHNKKRNAFIRQRSTEEIGRNRIFEPTRRHVTTRALVIILVGLTAISLGCLIFVFHPYEHIFKWKVIFSEGGETFELWRKPPAKLYLKVWLFNITNPDEFLQGEKVILNEVGPYVYREYIEHSNVTFHPNGTLSTVPLNPLVWEAELSNGTEQDILIMPNIAMLSIAHAWRDKSYLTRMGLRLLFSRTASQPLIKLTAREFMFDYESKLLTIGHNLLKSWLFFGKLGLIDRMYDFDGDRATIYTGENDVSLTGLYDTYNGNPRLPQWEGDHCANISKSSDATKFPSFLKEDSTVSFYRKSVCRVMEMVKTGESVVKGLQAYHYNFVNNSLDNGAIDERNKCFCRKGVCLPQGLIDVTDCYYGFPIAVSYPHFLEGDQVLFDDIDGLNPDRSKHESFVKIEPKAGLPLEVAYRFQINMNLGDLSTYSLHRFNHLVLPMIWTEIGTSGLPHDLNTRFQLYLNILPVLEKVLMYLMLAGGAVMVMACLFCKLGCSSSREAAAAEAAKGKAAARAFNKEIEVFYSSLLDPDKKPPPARKFYSLSRQNSRTIHREDC